MIHKGTRTMSIDNQLCSRAYCLYTAYSVKCTCSNLAKKPPKNRTLSLRQFLLFQYIQYIVFNTKNKDFFS